MKPAQESVQQLPYDPRPLNQAFLLLHPLGHGRFGSVSAVLDRFTGQRFACKAIPKKNPEHCQKILSEIRILHHLANTNKPLHAGPIPIITLKSIHEDEETLYLIMDLCTGGNLLDVMRHKKTLSEPEAAAVVHKVVQALAYCNERMVMHRDIKMENVCFLHKSDFSSVKLVDFGLATRMKFSEQRLTQPAGTIVYMAPEMLHGDYSKEADVWSLGVMLYTMLGGTFPFYVHDDLKATCRLIQHGELDVTSSAWTGVSSAAMDLIRGMICIEEDKRLKLPQILAHPWLVGLTAQKTGAAQQQQSDCWTQGLAQVPDTATAMECSF